MLPVSCLPSDYGIGTFGHEAYRFVDFLAAAGQRYWQVLPLGSTSYGDSPYQSFSAFAGNPYYIDLQLLTEQGLFAAGGSGSAGLSLRPDWVDYAKLYANRFLVLKKPGPAAGGSRTRIFLISAGKQDLAGGLCPVHGFEGFLWRTGMAGLAGRNPPAHTRGSSRLAKAAAAGDNFLEICPVPILFPMGAAQGLCQSKGIWMIGDIPIYVAMDSADVWTGGSRFQLDENRQPTAVAGVPPDLFSATGQLWGNPLYDWQAMEQDGFSWWRARMASCAALYDLVRIDHFIGFIHYYAIPAGEDTAINGRWLNGLGKSCWRRSVPLWPVKNHRRGSWGSYPAGAPPFGKKRLSGYEADGVCL